MMFLLTVVGWTALVMLFLAVVFFVVVPLVLCGIATIIPSPPSRISQLQHSTLYVGRVWHTRFQPKKHAFQYPIFMFALDLTELDGFRQTLWPLVPYILNIRPHMDHLKNGEGLGMKQNTTKTKPTTVTSTRTNNNNPSPSSIDFLDRILRLVAERTNHKFRPTSTTHRVIVLTHLCYYGYNFNPVSFYYIVNVQNGIIDAMVGEVSNTPWLEMYCYVLHPDSTDQVTVTVTPTTTTTTKTTTTTTDAATTATLPQQDKYFYSFPKTFHVSPFMEMDYWYDWTFLGIPQPIHKQSQQTPDNNNNKNNNNKNESITSSSSSSSTKISTVAKEQLCVINTLRRRSKTTTNTNDNNNNNKNNDKNNDDGTTIINSNNNHNTNPVVFTAKLFMDARQITPWTVTWQMMCFPTFCLLIQIWIHYQAFVLFLKGIVYVPHPMGSETIPSKFIATIMVPFFAIQEYIQTKTTTKTTTTTTSTMTPTIKNKMM
ncbi:DUF1365 domain containing protein [Nitzschia inconspicua]|uniref:DUF1365 domain containing protein n=1 Tax=Nitzschia inconspicua TaxID=303405 RepID=A0A9K3PWL0_9STRA|nr:DUF1365 domain containing protein [Nitzschia inconspicua]KAG7362487.1 DUF1365 domain containing protein [Nitzschia inconspicua]